MRQIVSDNEVFVKLCESVRFHRDSPGALLPSEITLEAGRRFKAIRGAPCPVSGRVYLVDYDMTYDNGAREIAKFRIPAKSCVELSALEALAAEMDNE